MSYEKNDIKILICDDEIRIRKIIKDFLTAKGYTVFEAGDGEEAIEIFVAEKDISLIILDIMMPKMDGYETIKEIRKYSAVPVLMLTAKGEENDELKGFDCGADEYISKPFRPRVLVARTEALLKRSKSLVGTEISAGEIVINDAAHTVKAAGEEVELSFKEYELLKYFVENRGIALSRDKILNNVWDFDYFGDERTVDTHVKKLRSKLLTCGDYIKTVRGLGYKFDPEKDAPEQDGRADLL